MSNKVEFISNKSDYLLELLKGDKNILKKTKYIYFECNTKLLKINNTSEREICTFLLEKNFKNLS